MKAKYLIVAAALAVAGISVAFAQTPVIPKVTSVSPGVDLVQVIPNGNPAVGNKYASVSQLFGGSVTNGMTNYSLPLTTFKTGTGIGMAASAAAGVFGVSVTAGTSLYLIGEAANSNTKTDTAAIEVNLPSSYIAGTNITVTVNCNYTLGSGTIGTHTLAGAAYLESPDGTQGSTLIATAAQSVPAAAGTVSFTITGASLVPGNRIWLTLTMVIQDSGGSNITGRINSVKLG